MSACRPGRGGGRAGFPPVFREGTGKAGRWFGFVGEIIDGIGRYVNWRGLRIQLEHDQQSSQGEVVFYVGDRLTDRP